MFIWILPLLYFIAILSFELMRKKARGFDLLTLFNLFYAIYYPFLAFNILAFESSFKVYSGASFAYLPEVTLWSITLLIVFHFLFTIAYLLSGPRNVTWRDAMHNGRSLDPLVSVLIAGTCVCFAALFLWCSDYGGVVNAIRIADLIRIGDIDSGRWSIMKQFYLPMSFFFALLFYLFLRRRDLSPSRLMLFYGFAPFVILVMLMVFLVYASRGLIVSLGLYVLAICLVHYGGRGVLYFVRKKIILIGLVGGMGILTIFYGNVVFSSLVALKDGIGAFSSEISKQLSYGQGRSVSEKYFKFIGNFSHYSVSIDASLEGVVRSGSTKPSFGAEIVRAIITIPPYRLTGIAPGLSVQDRNNLVINPAKYYGSGGSIPPGAVASSIYMFSFAGPVFVPICLGVFFRRVELYFIRQISDCTSAPFLYVSMIFLAYPFLISLDPHAYKKQFVAWCWLLLLMYLIKKGKRRIHV